MGQYNPPDIRKETGQQAAYLFIKLLSSSSYLQAPLQYTGLDFLFITLQILSIFGDLSTVYFYRELSPTSHCMHTIFWNISLKMTKIWQIKATHRTLSSVPSLLPPSCKLILLTLHKVMHWYCAEIDFRRIF